jgi:serine/threonine-protein kinase
VGVLDGGVYDPPGTWAVGYVVTEPLPPSLASLLERGAMGTEGAVHVGLAVSRTLATAHAAGLTHKALSSHHVHLGEAEVRVSGFGVSEAMNAFGGGLRTRPVPRDLGCWPPELVKGSSSGDASADVHGVAMLLHECTTGRPAYGGADLYERMRAILYGPVPELPAPGPRGAELGRLFERMAAKEPGDRPAMAEVIRSLEALRG